MVSSQVLSSLEEFGAKLVVPKTNLLEQKQASSSSLGKFTTDPGQVMPSLVASLYAAHHQQRLFH